MAFEISGAILVEGALEAGAADAFLAEAMPLAFESFSALAPEAFAGFGGETLSSLFGSELVPAAVQQAATPMAESALTGGMGAGEGITSAVKGAVETGAALPEATTPFAESVPSGMGVAPAEPVPVPEPAGMQQVSSPNAFNSEVRPGMELTDTGFQPTGEGVQPSGLEQVKATPGQSGVLNADGTVTAPDGSKVPWEEYSKVQGFDPSIKPPTPDSGFMEGFSNFVDKHPFMTGAGIYGVANATGMLNQKPQTFGSQNQTSFNNPYHFSDKFQGSHPNPQQYQPNYSGYVKSNYAGGGITQIAPQTDFATGGSAPLVGTPAANTTMDSTVGNNSMFPMSEMDRSYYATPTQLPSGISNNDKPQTPQSMAGTTGGYESKVDPYTGTMGMASGGIARYYSGELATSYGQKGDVYGATQRFLNMYDPASRYQAPSGTPDVGIFHDTNPSTRDKSAYQASGIRNRAIANKANVKTGANYMPPSRQMGQLNLNTPNAKADNDSDSDQVLTGASGGIMGANLGGYAAGGNPRLLRGPGDGMSDNIPATIGGRQPARLADGEFVVPADVVSHLGNGSTEAGAKRLHEMMDKVRVDRTGKKKQAPAVKAGKYIPK
jgi:hypothetical protein